MIFNKLLSAMDRGESVDIFTVIDGPADELCHIGNMVVVHRDETVDSQLEEVITSQLLDIVTTTLWIKPLIITVEDLSGRRYRFFWDRFTNLFRAVVFGGGHVSQALVSILSLLDFAVTVIDDRPEFACEARFPGAQKVICESFQRVLQQNLMIEQDTAVVIVTRGHRYDLECLRATMNSNARYLGMIGSRRRIRELLKVVKQEGAPSDIEPRLNAPIGLDIHAETPAEIAISIAAELVLAFRGGTGLPLGSRKEAF